MDAETNKVPSEDELNSLSELLDLLESRGVSEFSFGALKITFNRGFVPSTGPVMTRESEGTMPLSRPAETSDPFMHPSLWSGGAPKLGGL